MKNKILNAIIVSIILGVAAGQSNANELKLKSESQHFSGQTSVGVTNNNPVIYPECRRDPKDCKSIDSQVNIPANADDSVMYPGCRRDPKDCELMDLRVNIPANLNNLNRKHF